VKTLLLLAALAAATPALAQTPVPAAPVTAAQSYGACVWAKVPAADRQAFLKAYRSGMVQGMQALSKIDAATQRDFAACIGGRKDAPPLYAQAAVASEAIRYGAADILNANQHITRAQLDQGWRSAPPAPRNCVIAQAATPFKLNVNKCADASAALWFVSNLKIPATAKGDAQQVLYYYTAQAQAGWVQGLTQKLVQSPAKPS
jgi:hypothetical protein